MSWNLCITMILLGSTVAKPSPELAIVSIFCLLLLGFEKWAETQKVDLKPVQEEVGELSSKISDQAKEFALLWESIDKLQSQQGDIKKISEDAKTLMSQAHLAIGLTPRRK